MARPASSLLLIALAMGAPRVADAQLVPNAAAEAEFQRGREHLVAGRYADACRAFEASYKLEPQLGTLFNIGTCDEKLGKLASAWAAFREVAQRDQNQGRAKRAGELAKQLAPRLPKLVIDATSHKDGATVLLDGADVTSTIGVDLPVDLGARTLVVKLAGFKDETITTNVTEEGRRYVVRIPAMSPATSAATKPTLPTTTGAGTTGTGTTGAGANTATTTGTNTTGTGTTTSTGTGTTTGTRTTTGTGTGTTTGTRTTTGTGTTSTTKGTTSPATTAKNPATTTSPSSATTRPQPRIATGATSIDSGESRVTSGLTVMPATARSPFMFDAGVRAGGYSAPPGASIAPAATVGIAAAAGWRIARPQACNCEVAAIGAFDASLVFGDSAFERLFVGPGVLLRHRSVGLRVAPGFAVLTGAGETLLGGGIDATVLVPVSAPVALTVGADLAITEQYPGFSGRLTSLRLHVGVSYY